MRDYGCDRADAFRKKQMRTPICDFVSDYKKSGAVRLHMPGHKGRGELEAADITEIDGADSLYEADGIIAQSEKNAGALFGADSFYSTEGSSLCIRAMLYLTVIYADSLGKKCKVLAGRNAHKSFIYAAALLGFDISWIECGDSYLSCAPSSDELERRLTDMTDKPAAVYLTSPDYLGRTADIRGISEVCRRHGVLLLVDNAHGAYLKFLPTSRHPIDLGADMCSDSAHKTLPVLTGGAYLHISKHTHRLFSENAKSALSLFGSTSPSYLILQSLDRANAYIADGFQEKLSDTAEKIERIKSKLAENGYGLYGDEPMKITLQPKSYGYTGREIAAILLEKNIVCEFSDPDFVVMMPSAETSDGEMTALADVLTAIPPRSAINSTAPRICMCDAVMSPREAMLSASVTVKTAEAVGRVLARACVSCPPAVPIVVCGERIDENAVRAFEYYGIKYCSVLP